MYFVLGYIIQQLIKAQRKVKLLTKKIIGEKYQPSLNIKIKSRSDHKLKNQSAEQDTTSKSKAFHAQNTAQSSGKQMSNKNNDDSNYFFVNMSIKHKWKKIKTFGKCAAKKQKSRNTELNQEKLLKPIRLYFLKIQTLRRGFNMKTLKKFLNKN